MINLKLTIILTGAILSLTVIEAQSASILVKPNHLIKNPHAENLPTNRQGSPLIAQSERLTGIWNCNDGGVYFIRQIGNQVWWYGQSSDGGQTWSNVFQGTITGNKITGNWADVPKGSIRGNGWMTLSISGANTLTKIDAGGSGFGGSVWSR
jgi:hypothetical protein